MSNKLGRNPLEAEKAVAPQTVFPGDALIPEPQPENEDPTMARKTKTSTKSSETFRFGKPSLTEALERLRTIDFAGISQSIRSCRMDQFSLVRFQKEGDQRSLELLGLNLTHPFKLKRKTFELSPKVAKNWKLTLMNVHLTKRT